MGIKGIELYVLLLLKGLHIDGSTRVKKTLQGLL